MTLVFVDNYVIVWHNKSTKSKLSKTRSPPHREPVKLILKSSSIWGMKPIQKIFPESNSTVPNTLLETLNN